VKGTSLRALGRSDDAERVLREARQAADSLGFAPILWQIDMALGSIAADAGDTARAAELRGQAWTIVDHLAATIDDEQLRASFLALPEVKVVSAGGTLAP
jgi:uncharacterized membrane protein